jgi:Tfp pilus assembly protein FimT
MIVVGIMGVVLTMAVPMVYKVWHRAPMNQATKDIVEVLSTARARSILQGKPLHVVFYPRDGRLEVEGGGAQTNSTPALAGMSPGSSGGTAARLSDRVLIQMLDINKLPHDFREDDMARIRFFPNGTSDELTVILVDDKGEQQGITLEVTTGLASVLSGSELQRMRSGVR